MALGEVIIAELVAGNADREINLESFLLGGLIEATIRL